MGGWAKNSSVTKGNYIDPTMTPSPAAWRLFGNSHVYGTVTLAVNFTINTGASHLHDNHLVHAVRRNQRPDDFPDGQL
jgi:hypothetical protein